jgi:hypothetical protein
MITTHKHRQAALATLESAIRLLNSIDWATHGYADKYKWLREMYGDFPNPELIQMFKDQFGKEGLL